MKVRDGADPGATGAATAGRRARILAGQRLETFSGKADAIASLMLGSLKGYGGVYTGALNGVGKRLLSGRGLSAGELLADAAALSIEGLGATAEFWKSAIAICTSSQGAPASSRPGQVFFHIDGNTETTTPVPLGNVSVADFARLTTTALVREGGAEVIPSGNVKLTQDDGEVQVALANLKSVQPALVPGLYRGTIQRQAPSGSAPAAVTQVLVLLL